MHVQIPGPPQCGKTTLAVTLVIGAAARGLGALYVAPTHDMVRWVCERRGLARHLAVAANQAVDFLREGDRFVSIVVVDDAGRIEPAVLQDLREVLSRRVTPVQLIEFEGRP